MKKFLRQMFADIKIMPTFASQKKKDGSLDEWLSQRSAKPCTAVRIRQEPPKQERRTETKQSVFFYAVKKQNAGLLLKQKALNFAANTRNRTNRKINASKVPT